MHALDQARTMHRNSRVGGAVFIVIRMHPSVKNTLHLCMVKMRVEKLTFASHWGVFGEEFRNANPQGMKIYFGFFEVSVGLSRN